MTRLVYLTPRFLDDGGPPGAAVRYPVALAEQASRQGFDVRIVGVGPAAVLRPLGPNLTLQVVPSDATFAAPGALAWGLERAVADADAVHVFEPFTRFGEAAVLLARLHARPVVVTDLGSRSSRLGEQFGWLELADHVVAPSRFAAELLRTSRPITVVPGGISPVDLSPSVRDRHGFVFVGRIEPAKGLDRLLRALPDHVPLTCVGPPPEPGYGSVLRQLVGDKRVTFRPDPGAAREVVPHAWALVAPSVYRDCGGNDHPRPELCGLAVQEALGWGTPVVAARVGSLPEWVTDGVNGLLFDSTEELARHLSRLAADAAFRRHLAAGSAPPVTSAALAGVYAALVCGPDRRAA